ncbi:MAG: type 4a pilus biogenesis protein PilO [Candidatus Omnitrophica bacterium]|nr:type 4a pilus biogenesis protein PilO [Candidatus Omnitrophota bacterium]
MATSVLAKNKNVVLNLVLIVAGVLLALQIYKHLSQSIDALNGKIDDETKKNELLTDIASKETQVEEYRKALGEGDSTFMINALSKLAKETRLEIVSLRPDQEAREDLFHKTMVSLVVQAKNYHEIGRFLSMIESFPQRYLKVERMSIQPIQSYGEAAESLLKADLQVSALSLEQPISLGQE